MSSPRTDGVWANSILTGEGQIPARRIYKSNQARDNSKQHWIQADKLYIFSRSFKGQINNGITGPGVKNVKIAALVVKGSFFLPITFKLIQWEQKLKHNRDLLVDTHRNVYMMISLSHSQHSTVDLRSRDLKVTSMSANILFDASWSAEHNDNISTAVLFPMRSF